MRRDILSSALAIAVLTLALGVGYPLLVTGLAQALFPGQAGGSRIERGGATVGSSLIAQGFSGARWFHPRPSVTGYDPAATAFANLGPNSAELRDAFAAELREYLGRERRHDRGLTRAEVPVDAVTGSGSGVDPHISPANARIQARRVAAVRGLPPERVLALVDAHTEGRFLGLLGEPGVNVLELNLALDGERR
jgi:K+-transporting ATPase ATPase C chain